MSYSGQPEGRAAHRREIFAAELREQVQNLITRGLNDPRVQGMITVTRVDLAPDMSRASFWVSVLPEKNQAKVIAGLRHASKHFRHQLGEKIKNMRMPEIAFELDTGLKKQAAVIQALAKVAAEREEKNRLAPGGGAGNNEGQSPPSGGSEEPTSP